MLTKDSTPYDLNKNLPPQSSLRRNFTISYDANATDNFPKIPNTKKETQTKTKHPNTRSNGKHN